MIPSPEAIGFMLLLILLFLILAVLFVVKIRDKNYFKALVAALLCGFVAFVCFTVSQRRFSLISTLLVGFPMGFIAGAAWSAAVQAVTSVAPIGRYKYFPSASEIWTFGVLPSCVYLGYVISILGSAFWWLKLVVVLFSGITVVGLCKGSGLKVREHQRLPQPPMKLWNSPVLWLPLIIISVFFGVALWF